VLNIGKLAPGAADYYIGEVATSAEDYYTGRGESPGRWVGSLAAQLGLEGSVDPDAFHALLEGRDPVTGEHLVRGRSGACRTRRLPDPNQATLFEDDNLDVAQVAARLKLTTRRIRQLLAAGVTASGEGSPVRPATTLVGERIRVPDQRGPLAWSIPRAEVERFEAERQTVKTRPGYDLTLRPPKSVSVLWAVADQDRRIAIRDAHREAVDAVVAYYERHACFARRPTGDRSRIETDGIVAAAFDHRASRAGDPLLHTHVVCANLTRTAEGRWQAIDGRPIYDHAHAAGYLYQAHLRHTLTTRLGVRFGAVRNGYAEVDGVPREVVKAFSKRRDEIEEVVAESGYTSARAHQVATLATRKAKDYGVDTLTLEGQWRDEAAALGFGPAEIDACFDQATEPERPQREDLFAYLAGAEGLTAEASTFRRQDVVEAIAESAGASMTAEEIDALAGEFLASPHVRALAAKPGEPGCGLWRREGTRERTPDLARYTTPELLGLEAQILRWAENGFGTPAPRASYQAVEDAIAQRPELSREQVAMVRAVCGTTDSVQAIAGRPGSGKTHAMAACVDGYLSSGIPVVGCALSAVAAAELEASTGLLDRTGRPASTIARLLLETREAGLAPGTVLVVDEASMVGTRDLASLAALAARAGGALKLIGDPDQHGPVETGGAFRYLVDAGADTPRLTENNRQDDPNERRAVEEFRQELVELSLSRYDKADKVVRSRTATESYTRMVDDWLDHVRAGGGDPMIAGTNHVRRELNRRARARLVAVGDVHGPALDVGETAFQQGDWIVARRNMRTLKSRDGQHFVKNGSTGRVAAVDLASGCLKVDFNVEGRIDLPPSYVQAGHVDHGYARTSYGVQGATLDRAFYHPGDSSSFEEGYVALTRGRRETRLYIVDGAPLEQETDHRGHDRQSVGVETVAEAMERRRSKQLAHEQDPLASVTLDTFGDWTLAALRAERDRLDAVLAAAPPSVDDAIDKALAKRDALLARRQAWDTDCATRRRWFRRVDPRERTDGIDRALTSCEHHLSRLLDRKDARDEFLDAHNPEVERLRLVYRAELARELQVRADAVAHPDPALLTAVGGAPNEPERFQRWRDALERAAVHADRFGTGADADDAAAARSYERVREAFLAAEAVPARDRTAAEVFAEL